MKVNLLFILACAIFLFSCSSDNNTSQSEENEEPNKPNILLIIADDMGLDATPGYSIGDIKPTTPNLQNMIDTGIRFTNFWSYPVCTPTRASILTGKYGFRTGVLKVDDDLSPSETSLHQYLTNQSTGYNSGIVGKWHLGTGASEPGNFGISYYAGLLSGGVRSYEDWSLNENGVNTTSTEYVTTKLTDLAINWIDDQESPWFLWLAYNAPHTPFHLPPSDLHSQGDLPNDEATIDANPLAYYLASIEAMDAEIGRLLNSLSETERDNTIIIFIGDNGSPSKVAQEYNRRRVKGSLYQGGINVPMIISGKNVTRTNSIDESLLGTTDLFATIANLAGVNSSSIHDSKSFSSLLTTPSTNSIREYVYSEVGNDTNDDEYTIRNASHKYILFADGSEALYHLQNDALENTNLLNDNQLPLSTEDEAQLNLLKEAIINIKQ
ncbi:sulfatase-like hydrolase/transferase [Aquimarina sp. 433]